MDPKKETKTENTQPSESSVEIAEIPTPSVQPNQVTTGPAPKKRTKLIIFAIVLMMVLVGAATLTLSKQKKDVPESAATTSKEQSKIEVAITDAGFTPATLVVKTGTTVVWKNTTASPHRIGSNPYPDHSSLTDFYSPLIGPGETYVYTFNKAGNWGYTDYTKPTIGGSVVVQ